MAERATGPQDRTGRNYVVVSADTHASPDSLDHFLSYVDPAHREAVAAFGDMSSLAISMFGGFDPGEVDESDPVRATAARRLAGMGVDTDAASGWLAHYGTDWVVPGDGGGRRLAVLEEQGIHAEVTLPGTHPRRRPVAGDVPGRGDRQGPRGGVAGPARLRPLAGRLLRRRARAGVPAACPSTSTTWTVPSRRWPGPGTTASSAA